MRCFARMSPRVTTEEVLDGADAILFDMDGVLLDTEALYTQATRQVLQERADDFTWDIKRQLMGRSPHDSAAFLIEALGLELSSDEFLKRKRPILLSLFPASEPRPGAAQFVQACASRKIPMAVATSSDRLYFEAKTNHHDWFQHFAAVVCGSDAEVEKYKPAPDIFLVAAAKLSVSAQRCVVFEDSLAGMEAARNAHAHRVVALPDPRMDRSFITHADLVLDSFEQIQS